MTHLLDMVTYLTEPTAMCSHAPNNRYHMFPYYGYYTSPALGSNGYPNLSYCDYTNGNLKYALWKDQKHASAI